MESLLSKPNVEQRATHWKVKTALVLAASLALLSACAPTAVEVDQSAIVQPNIPAATATAFQPVHPTEYVGLPTLLPTPTVETSELATPELVCPFLTLSDNPVANCTQGKTGDTHVGYPYAIDIAEREEDTYNPMIIVAPTNGFVFNQPAVNCIIDGKKVPMPTIVFVTADGNLSAQMAHAAVLEEHISQYVTTGTVIGQTLPPGKENPCADFEHIHFLAYGGWEYSGVSFLDPNVLSYYIVDNVNKDPEKVLSVMCGQPVTCPD